MGKKPRVTRDWLRKGRRVEDTRIVQQIIDDSSPWKLSTASLSQGLFEKTYGLEPIPKEHQSALHINEFLGQSAVTETVRINKNDLTPVGTDFLHQVGSLLPGNLEESEKECFSYVFGRMIIDDTPQDVNWPFVPMGLDSLSAALFTLNMVADLTEGSVRWLHPIWSLKASQLKIEQLQSILDFAHSDAPLNEDSEEFQDNRREKKTLLDVMLRAKEEIEKFLRKDALSHQDPLSDKIDTWISTITSLTAEKNSLKNIKSRITRARKKASNDPDTQSLDELIHERQISESTIANMHETAEANLKVLTEEIQTLKVNNRLITEWNSRFLHPDGPTASKHEFLLKNFRADLSILDYEPLVRMCKALKSSERPGRPAASDIEKEMGFKKRMSYYALHRFGLLLNEHFILTPSLLGLRYRYVFTEKQKPGVLSDGLMEWLNLSDSEEYSGCTMHIEPVDTEGPQVDDLPDNAFQITCDSELISMKLDLYDATKHRWILEPWKAASRTKSSLWLIRSTEPNSTLKRLRVSELDLIGILSYFRGLRSARRWLLEQIGFNLLTARRNIKSLVDDKMFRLLYLPSVQYCGLPIGMILGGQFSTKRSRTSFISWMTSRLPYARILTGESSNLVAYLRLPQEAVTTVRSIIREHFETSNVKDTFIGGILDQRTYLLTAFHNLSIEKGKEWKDPWA